MVAPGAGPIGLGRIIVAAIIVAAVNAAGGQRGRGYGGLVRTVIITGVSGGLGEALVDRLYESGDRLIALGRRFTARQRELAGADPDRVRLRPTDLADLARLPDATELAGLLAGPTGRGGPTGDNGATDDNGATGGGDREVALIHNAGVLEPIGAVGALPADQIIRAVAVNLTAPVLLTNALLAATADRSWRVRVLFISSGAAEHVVEGWGPYCATKAGGRMFFDVLVAQAAADPRLSVASVNPGVMDTAMQAMIRESRVDYFPRQEHYVRLHAEGGLPAPADVAARILAEHLPG